jgi:uncharacterized protein YcfJ
MKKGILIFATAGSLLSGVSCGPNAQTGAALGGLGGAAVGGIIGHQSGRGLEGAAIGAAAGAGTGALIGNAQDEREQRDYNRYRESRRYYEGY